MTEENKLYYDLLTEQCRINTDEIIENPPVAISMGETTINTIKGKTTIDISTGISKNSETEMTITAQGMNITGTTKVTVSKM